MIQNLNWDDYFLSIAEVVSKKSHCLSIQRGCVLVREKQILSTGYNGPPSKYPHCSDLNIRRVRFPNENNEELFKRLDLCPRKILGYQSGEGLEYCPASHAEVNSIIQASKNGVSIKGSTLYCSFKGIPCRECSKAIITSGIVKIVLSGVPEDYQQIGIRGLDLLKECGVEVIGA